MATYSDLLKADDGKPETVAPYQQLSIKWDDPSDAPDAGVKSFGTMTPIVMAGYEARKRRSPGVTAGPRPTRADIRLGLDADGELYVTSKIDGMIRAIVAAE